MKLASVPIFVFAAGIAAAYGFVAHPGLGRAQQVHAGASGSSSVLMMATRRPIIAGNWKMNPLELKDAVDLASEVSGWLGMAVGSRMGDWYGADVHLLL
jgi:hypothetical protein